MSFEIVGQVDKDKLFCTGSFSKQLTTYACLSLLAEHFDLNQIIDDINFLDRMSETNSTAREFLHLFQKLVGGKFSLHDVCSYYLGLPYTFSLSPLELNAVEEGLPFKHHSILKEEWFLQRCRENISPLYPVASKFHYSELCIIFLGYFIEQVYQINIESLYEKFVLNKFKLAQSTFSRTIPSNAFIQDLSYKYDYPSIAILDHGYFCYSNGFYTTITDMKILLEQFIHEPIFQFMVKFENGRAASNRLLNGLAIEMRLVGDDIVYGYEGLSFSGCNIWGYSTKLKKGYLTFCDSEEDAYKIIYDNAFGYKVFDKVPDFSQVLYKNFLATNKIKILEKDFPLEFQGSYRRVRINISELDEIFEIGKTSITIRNPDRVTYPVIFSDGHYHVKGQDNLPSIRVDLYKSLSGKCYMLFDGTLYWKLLID